MSKSTIETVMKRIAFATVASPIAVFRLPESESEGKFLDSVFADTVRSRREMKRSTDNLIGVYNRRHSKNRVEAELIAALNERKAA